MHSSLSGAEQSFGPPRYVANDNRTPTEDINDLLDLWGAVIRDALLHKESLNGWIRSEDFDFVCDCAGVDPGTMRWIARKVIRGELIVAPKGTTNKRFMGQA